MKTSMIQLSVGASWLLMVGFAHAQIPPAVPFSSDFNSSFALSSAQIELGHLDEALTASVNAVVNYDRSTNYANGGARQDDFYTVTPQDNTTILPGQLLKVQEVTDPEPYAIAPGTSLSKIMYTTKNFNGTVIPASAYILWPFQPRKHSTDSADTAPRADAILWAHGTSGYQADSAPSTYRNLYYENIMPLHLALAGYAVVAPDYAGLGVERSWDGSFIPHQLAFMPAAANDMLYAMEAALSAFGDRLSGEYAVVGHSQGGGVAWATAELLASVGNGSTGLSNLVEGYVGTVTFAPLTDALNVPGFGVPTVGMNLDSIFPDFTLDQWLTPLAIDRLKLMQDIQGSSTVAQQLFLNLTREEVVNDGWFNSSYHAEGVGRLASAGRKEIAGPMLVLQGTSDFFVTEAVTSSAFNATCAVNPGQHLEYMRVQDMGHTPFLAATRHLWMDWLDERFKRQTLEAECKRTSVSAWLGSKKHFLGSNSYAQWAAAPEYRYQNAGAI